MNIAQVAPLYESVPPVKYGGTERIVSLLTEHLVAAGHAVTLFASGDSRTASRLVPGCERSLRLGLHMNNSLSDHLAPHVLQLEKVLQMAREFDIIHFHTGFFHFPSARRISSPTVTTMHGRLDIPDLVRLSTEFCDIPVVSISSSQRRPLHFMNWVGTVQHGLRSESIRFSKESGTYLAFLGRICPEKGIEGAVEISRRTGVPLKVAAKVDPVDRAYYETRIRRLFRANNVEFIGEVNDGEKSDFLGKALALVFPICWPEPFGLTMIESLAAGTPVIAYRRGSVPEIVRHGVSGFITDSMEKMVEAVDNVSSIDRAACRAEFERRFTVDSMVSKYLEIYKRLGFKTKRSSVMSA